MKMPTLKAIILSSVFLAPYALYAQSDGTPTAEPEAATAEEAALMTPEELQTLVGPVALYPDTLLIQVLVAATYPLDVIKADRLLKDNADTEAEALKGEIDAQGWDESVAVLATAFPDVLTDMAANIDWTETIGNAMLAQDQDVMDAIQAMREIANDNGALQSGDEQVVEVTQEQNGDQTIIIQPTDPQVVYVPEYKTEVVYVDSSSGVDAGDAVAAGLIAFGTFVVMDAIFNDNDPWHGYWGCRNCGGWGGGPVVVNPRNVTINGDVNIGNNVGWKADPRRQAQARTQLSRRSGPNGTRPVPVKRDNRGDALRSDLSRRSGAADISRRDNPAAGVNRPAKAQRPATQRPAAQRPAAQRPSTGQRPAAQRATPGNRGGNAAVNRTAAPAKARPPVKKPQAARATAPTRKPSKPKGGAMNNRAAAPKARSGGSRGRASSGGGRRR